MTVKVTHQNETSSSRRPSIRANMPHHDRRTISSSGSPHLLTPLEHRIGSRIFLSTVPIRWQRLPLHLLRRRLCLNSLPLKKILRSLIRIRILQHPSRGDGLPELLQHFPECHTVDVSSAVPAKVGRKDQKTVRMVLFIYYTIASMQTTN